MQQRQQDEAVPTRVPRARRRQLVVAASTLLIIGAAVDYLRGLELLPAALRIPFRELVVSPELKSVDAVPSRPGALSGQNLLIVTLDTTRPDRLGCYGNAASVSPNLDRLARDGVVFSQAVAVASTTFPTHASMLTGLYPHHHGARANAVFSLDDRHRTLAELLSDHGYATAAFVSSLVLDKRFGLNQGFDHYDDGPMGKVTRFGPARRGADETTEAARAWLRLPRTGPFFLWVHYYDAHSPYEPPAPFDKTFENAYDGEIAFVDQQLGRLLEEIESAPGPGTLVVVTADHGEALGEHGEETHGLLVQEATLRIPLVMRAANGLSGGFHIRKRVSQVDLAPTLLSLLGVGAPRDLDGLDLTIAPAIPDASRLVLAESVEGRVNFAWAPLTALYRGAYKYVDGPTPEFYDLRQDPLEQHDLAVARAGNGEEEEWRKQMAVLARQLRPRLSAAESATSLSRPGLDSDEIERLHALGYLVTDGTVVPQVTGFGSGPDPKEMLPLYKRLQRLITSPDSIAKMPLPMRALAWLSKDPWPRSPEALLRDLEEMAAEHPDFSPVDVYLQELYRQADRPEEARLAGERLKRFFQAASGNL